MYNFIETLLSGSKKVYNFIETLLSGSKKVYNFIETLLSGSKKVYWPPGPPGSLSSRLDSTASNNTLTGTDRFQYFAVPFKDDFE